MAKIGSIVEGKYEILKEIGRGGMSVVYLAMDTHLNKQWAVKEIQKRGKGKKDEIIVNSLLVEANLMKHLDHPALPRIVDILDHDETISIIMDYIEGESLDKILDEFGAQPEERVIDWAKQLCDVLKHLHSLKKPIIYGDMKPSNVMLKPEGNIKIIDFGIAREYKEKSFAETTFLGTKGYAPPEQYDGQTDIRSDIYALGMTMHHLLTGKDPRNHAYAPVRIWKPELSEGIEIIIDKCVHKDPEKRYQNCSDLLYDLDHPNLITKEYKKRQKRKLAAFTVSLAMTVLFALGGICFRAGATAINNDNYDILVSPAKATSLNDKIAGYKQAIGIYPERLEAYFSMLEAYEDEGHFGKKENDEFLAVYNANKDKFDISRTKYAELNYKIGLMYFNYYTDNGSVGFSTRVQKAYSFFAANFENEKISPEFKNKSISDCYYRICYFYKKYILNSATVEEASKDNYEDLFGTINDALLDVESAGAYDRLALYNGTFMFLYDQRGSMAQVNVDKEEIMQLLDTLYRKSDALSVQKEKSRNLKDEIIENYAEYKNAIERAYVNVEKNNE